MRPASPRADGPGRRRPVGMRRHRGQIRPAAAVMWAAGQIVPAAAWAVLTLAATLTFYTLVPLAAGWRPAVVTSGSMSPALHPGDVVLFAPPTGRPPAPGTIVLFRPAGTGPQVAHRVAAVRPDGQLVTRGDANQMADSALLPASAVDGDARLVVPRIGVVRLLGSPYWRGGACWLLALSASALLVLAVPRDR